MTKGELERLAVLEAIVERIEAKLDDALECKADKTDVDELKATATAHTQQLANITGALKFVMITAPIVLTIIGIIAGTWVALADK